MPLAERLKIDLPRLKSYLRVDYDEDDALLLDLAKAAKDQVDLFLNNDFMGHNELGELVELPIPFSISLAIYQMVGAWYETRQLGVTSKNIGGITYQLGQTPIETINMLAPYRVLVGL